MNYELLASPDSPDIWNVKLESPKITFRLDRVYFKESGEHLGFDFDYTVIEGEDVGKEILIPLVLQILEESLQYHGDRSVYLAELAEKE